MNPCLVPLSITDWSSGETRAGEEQLSGVLTALPSGSV